MTGIELDYICDTCGFPVEDGQGALYVKLADIRDHNAAKREWEQTHDPHQPLDLPSLLMMPRPIPWHIHHDVCAPSSTEDVYDITVAQVRTWRQLVKWTAHLMAKNWLPATNWAVVIESAAEGRDRRIVEHAHNDAA